MKKIILTLLLAVTATSAFAQAKGDLTVGGLIGVSTEKHHTVFAIEPEVGCFVADKAHIGFSLGYELGVEPASTEHLLKVGPNFSYFLEVAHQLFYAPEIGVDYVFADHGGAKFNGFGIDLDLVRFEYEVNHHIAVALNAVTFAYEGLWEAKTNHNENEVAFNFLLNPTIGFIYKF